MSLAWLWHLLGFDAGAPYGHIVPYNVWSGFGADVGEIAIVGGIATLVRKHKCHVHGCWRYARYPVEGTPYVVCYKHHPEMGQKVTAKHVAIAFRKGMGN